MSLLSRVWKLEEERRASWRRRALEVDSRPNLGQYGGLDGRHPFLETNKGHVHSALPAVTSP